jgi:hypothetical protein
MNTLSSIAHRASVIVEIYTIVHHNQYIQKNQFVRTLDSSLANYL